MTLDRPRLGTVPPLDARPRRTAKPLHHPVALLEQFVVTSKFGAAARDLEFGDLLSAKWRRGVLRHAGLLSLGESKGTPDRRTESGIFDSAWKALAGAAFKLTPVDTRRRVAALPAVFLP